MVGCMYWCVKKSLSHIQSMVARYVSAWEKSLSHIQDGAAPCYHCFSSDSALPLHSLNAAAADSCYFIPLVIIYYTERSAAKKTGFYAAGRAKGIRL